MRIGLGAASSSSSSSITSRSGHKFCNRSYNNGGGRLGLISKENFMFEQYKINEIYVDTTLVLSESTPHSGWFNIYGIFIY